MINGKANFFKTIYTISFATMFSILSGCGGSSTGNSSTGGDVTGVATLNWTPPTMKTDSSNLDDLSGYRIYYGTSSNLMTNVIVINNGLSSYVVENLMVNTTYYFTITAFNSSGVDSDYSNFANKTITTS